MSIDNYIKDLSEFDYLLNEETFALRRKIGFYWFGKPEITDLDKTHNIKKNQMFLHLKNKYHVEYKILEEYLKTDISNRNFNSFAYLTDYDKDILQKYKISYGTYSKSFETKHGCVPNFYFVSNELKKITDEFTKKSIVIEYIKIKDCSICMNSIQKINCITDCNHQFHKSCINEWIKFNNSCPVCRHTNLDICKVSFESTC